ncbi:Orotate phosphoribosyltransferase [Candidatus Desulfarcum epimagneticum]|uniref:Orotate phosphoribosyltransferase n=1 Tax=uncultured Desulfobacteraceae bacterium TaxID=218296 RepID=A0A484HII7_9BACT|nr:Orotate phosphoribosyltransferase [uncultured Desulfobacteraceae bacterium]
MKQKLIDMLCRVSFQCEDEPVFKLASGRLSRYYVNCRPAVLSPEGMFLAGSLVFDRIADLKPAGVGGLTFGADPIAIAAAFVSGLKKKPVKAFSLKKEKAPGARWMEGDLKAGDRVVIIDDVATTGGSTVKAIERARLEGLEVEAAVILVDRQEGGMDNIRDHAPRAWALITRTELTDHLKRM